MVILLRCVNVPARFATGYAAHRENTITGYYEVRQKDAHAWVEAYIEGYGWMTFEPTSSFEIPRGSRNVFAASGIAAYLQDRMVQAVRANPGAWWAEMLGKLLKILNRLWSMLQELYAALMSVAQSIIVWLKGSGWIVLLLLLASFGIALPLFKLVDNFSRRFDLEQVRKKDARQFIIQCYHEMEKVLSGKKLLRRPFRTPSEFAPLIKTRQPHLASSVDVITGLFNLARYSAFPLSAADADNAFKAYSHIVKHVDRKQKQQR